MHGARLDEHVLQLKLSSRSSAGADAAAGSAAVAGSAKRAREPAAGKAADKGGKPSNKLAVRNVPFEANKRELRELFAAFGQLKTCAGPRRSNPGRPGSDSCCCSHAPGRHLRARLRLPKKFDGSHRGFAFVEFVSKQEAAKALAALQSTHLYGRHIVVSYAEQEQSVEEMRKKMRRQLADETASLGKRTREDEGGGAGGEQEALDLGFEI